jgi:hypothetical protein
MFKTSNDMFFTCRSNPLVEILPIDSYKQNFNDKEIEKKFDDFKVVLLENAGLKNLAKERISYKYVVKII